MRRAVAVLGVAAVVGCGETTADSGTTTSTGDASSSGGARDGSDAAVRGGSAGDGQVSSGAGGAPSGRQGAEGGAAGGGDDCNEFWLWYTVTEAAVLRLGECGPSAELCNGSAAWGVVVFDREGRATDITGVETAREEEWIQEVAGERWPCLADQTVEYCCLPGP